MDQPKIFCDNEAMYKNASTPESQLLKKHHGISYHMAREAVASGACCIENEDTSTDLADLFTKVLPRPRRDYIPNNFTYWELGTNDKIIISGSIKSHPRDYTINLTTIEYTTIRDPGDRGDPVSSESCDLSWTSAEALMGKCVMITDDPSGGGMIKCEWLNSKSFEG